MTKTAIGPILLALAAPAGGGRVFEDFESFPSQEAFAKAWYGPPHGNWMRQTLAPRPGRAGAHVLRFEYRTEPGEAKYYAAICRVNRWNLAGYDAVRFWLKPDGSGREMTLQFNLADARGDNIHDLWQASYRPEKGDVAPRRVTIPFARLVHPAWLDRAGKRASFAPAEVIELALYVGSPDSPFGEGVYQFDDFEAVRVHDDLAVRALAAMTAKAAELHASGAAVVAWTEGGSVRGWSSRMAVVGGLAKPAVGADPGANLLGVAYAKAAEVAETGRDSGAAGRRPMTGELGWPGGVVLKGETGLLIAAFSGGPSEDDVKIARAGLDVLAGASAPE